jgi:hypothetical protein
VISCRTCLGLISSSSAMSCSEAPWSRITAAASAWTCSATAGSRRRAGRGSR